MFQTAIDDLIANDPTFRFGLIAVTFLVVFIIAMLMDQFLGEFVRRVNNRARMGAALRKAVTK